MGSPLESDEPLWLALSKPEDTHQLAVMYFNPMSAQRGLHITDIVLQHIDATTTAQFREQTQRASAAQTLNTRSSSTMTSDGGIHASFYNTCSGHQAEANRLLRVSWIARGGVDEGP